MFIPSPISPGIKRFPRGTQQLKAGVRIYFQNNSTDENASSTRPVKKALQSTTTTWSNHMLPHSEPHPVATSFVAQLWFVRRSVFNPGCGDWM